MQLVTFTARKDAATPDGIPVAQIEKTGKLIIELADSPYQIVIEIPKGERKKGKPMFNIQVTTALIADHEDAAKVKQPFGQKFVLAGNGMLVLAERAVTEAAAAPDEPDSESEAAATNPPPSTPEAAAAQPAAEASSAPASTEPKA